MALLEIRNVTRRFGDFTAVDNVSISIEAGEFFTLLGPSGCGKTTLLRMIAGFDLPDAGHILLDGKDMADTPPEQRPIHTVFQSYALFPHMTVADNIAFPLKMAGKTPAEIKSGVSAALSDVRLSNFGNRFPHELSGGQKQRVALARGLVNRPRLLLLDEPLGALDAKLREEMQIELINLQKEVGVTFVFVTHAQYEALALSHRIAVMNQGNVEQIDEPARIYGLPQNRFVADFIGKINMMDAQVLEAAPSHLKLSVAGLGEVTAPGREGVKTGDKGVMAIRPEQVWISRYPADTALAKPSGAGGGASPLSYPLSREGREEPSAPLSAGRRGVGGEVARSPQTATSGGNEYPSRGYSEESARPEEAELKNHFPGKVHDFLYVGDVTTYIVELPNGTRIEALLPNSAPGRAKFFEAGDPVVVAWRHDAGTFLNE